jgi:hypothetical protein
MRGEELKNKIMINIELIDQEKVSLDQVTQNLLVQEFGTEWAEKTNGFAVKYIEHLTEVYGDCWYKGFLPKEYLWQILLPKHPHLIKHDDDTVFFFPIDTPVKEATNLLMNVNPELTKECIANINYIKEGIQKNGFTSSIVLAVINDTLKHVDGLHRMIALAMLLEEGYQYKPIPVFLCDNIRNKE